MFSLCISCIETGSRGPVTSELRLSPHQTPLALSPDCSLVSQVVGEAGEVAKSELGSCRQAEWGLNPGSPTYVL